MACSILRERPCAQEALIVFALIQRTLVHISVGTVCILSMLTLVYIDVGESEICDATQGTLYLCFFQSGIPILLFGFRSRYCATDR
jgi:hypothetical protein